MILNNFDMNSKLLFEQHSVLVFGEKSFIKETREPLIINYQEHFSNFR